MRQWCRQWVERISKSALTHKCKGWVQLSAGGFVSFWLIGFNLEAVVLQSRFSVSLNSSIKLHRMCNGRSAHNQRVALVDREFRLSEKSAQIKELHLMTVNVDFLGILKQL